MSDELARKMRGRIEQCRRLARQTTDIRAAEILRQMADEGEADLRRLLAGMAGEGPGEPGEPDPPPELKMPPPSQS